MLRQKDIIQTIIDAAPIFDFKMMSDKKRLSNKLSISQDLITEIIVDKFNPSFITVFLPGQIGNPSSKYSSVVFTAENRSFTVINCNYVNRGIAYEKVIDDHINNKTEVGQKILDHLKITKDDVQTLMCGAANNARSIYTPEIPNVGSVLADVVVTSGGVDHYLSIKSKNGTGLVSSGNIQGLSINGNNVSADSSKLSKTLHANLFDYCNIDLNLVRLGLDNYLTKNKLIIPTMQADQSNFKNIIGLIHRSYGYGYHLVREVKDTIEILDLTKEETLLQLVHSIKSVTIDYPNYKRKHTSVNIEVYNALDNKLDNYKIYLRNAAGSILPLGVRVTKS